MSCHATPHTPTPHDTLICIIINGHPLSWETENRFVVPIPIGRQYSTDAHYGHSSFKAAADVIERAIHAKPHAPIPRIHLHNNRQVFDGRNHWKMFRGAAHPMDSSVFSTGVRHVIVLSRNSNRDIMCHPCQPTHSYPNDSFIRIIITQTRDALYRP